MTNTIAATFAVEGEQGKDKLSLIQEVCEAVVGHAVDRTHLMMAILSEALTKQNNRLQATTDGNAIRVNLDDVKPADLESWIHALDPVAGSIMASRKQGGKDDVDQWVHDSLRESAEQRLGSI